MNEKKEESDQKGRKDVTCTENQRREGNKKKGICRKPKREGGRQGSRKKETVKREKERTKKMEEVNDGRVENEKSKGKERKESQTKGKES